MHNIKFNSYINSPITFIHQIKHIIKVYLIFSILIIIPYYSYLNITLEVLLLVSLFFIYLMKYVNMKSYFLSFYIMYILFFNIYQYNYYTNHLLKVIVYIPYKLYYLVKKNQKSNHCYICFSFYLYQIPLYSKIIATIHTSYFILINCLFKFTPYELILTIIINLLNKVKLINCNNDLISLLISHQFLKIIINDIIDLYNAIQIKYINLHIFSVFNYIKTVYLLINIYFIHLLGIKQTTIDILWLKNINKNLLKKLYF
uniref:Uncharacterized protein n=1 Tax=Lophocladia kuetzingii TaxID=675577 RepID=A0A1Z1MNV9_9FLOR|nr:hypothetical protein [Lophocladia kuetzingii]ARW67626.1 hypothetical protein [Lophocladia kuetzingii]